MTAVLDPEGAHLAALRRLGDFRAECSRWAAETAG
jgi:hypothetical protein